MPNYFSYQKVSKVACTFPDWLPKAEGKPDNHIHPKETAQIHIKSLPKCPTDGILYSPAAREHPEEPSALPLTGGCHESIWENSSP